MSEALAKPSELAVGRVAPEALLLTGAERRRDLEHALRTGGHVPLRFNTFSVFAVGGVVLALATVVLVVAQA